MVLANVSLDDEENALWLNTIKANAYRPWFALYGKFLGRKTEVNGLNLLSILCFYMVKCSCDMVCGAKCNHPGAPFVLTLTGGGGRACSCSTAAWWAANSGARTIAGVLPRSHGVCL